MVNHHCLMFELSSCIKESNSYLEAINFIRLLRTDSRIIANFIDQVSSISIEDQINYMSSNYRNYFVAYYKGIPVGFGGVIDNDIRYAVVPYYHNMGFGTIILEYIKKRNPESSGKIRRSNLISIKVFDKVGIPYKIID